MASVASSATDGGQQGHQSERPAWTNLTVAPLGMGGQQLLSESLRIQRFEPPLDLIATVNPIMTGVSLVAPPDMQPVKEIIHCKSCTLFPQNPNLPPPSTRERPPGCKTVFVGGLPENATDDIIREVFSPCGDITAIRKSKKNFCHIRFSQHFMVDKAMYLSGYRMRIGSSTDKKDSGKIHVDFAQARDDLYEWECQQRLMAREERHRQTLWEDRQQPPSPAPIVHFSEHEAATLAEGLKDNHKFSEATAVLLTWMDRGEVNRRTANQFYSMIQSANGHVRRLLSEKAVQEEEMERAKEAFKCALVAILTQFEQISAVFTAASRQKAWDHFSKAQRKNIDIWRKQCEELMKVHGEEIMGIRREEEMEMSDEDSDESPCKKICKDSGVCDQMEAGLREENVSLRWQLEAYMKEAELARKEAGKEDNNNVVGLTRWHFPDASMQLLQQSVISMQQQLHSLQEQLASKEAELEQAKEEHHFLEGEVLSLQDKGVSGCLPSTYLSRERSNVVLSEKEALLLGVISTFLHVHPFGANLEYLWSYMQRLDSKVSAGQLERLMVRLPLMFRQELSGVGATLEKRWKFCGFDSLSSG
uniref:ecto-NOX disulfide-thiol exchanger 1-like isoform X1 n=2 Tax=Doryrhamphus excisus TaxID=161450 RepID=UPI0025AE46D0|nr:ecto-NOX disulfide-thiol exchanger 1-like isoform X1 [Doryrhamphus excisus]XP_057938669.1 ecto-NOX disulfide-thiol exchanger 1-like isoform X1 [Doryrhamphus excisus]XP_057938670.1 ecto-NOX disulfide-thiol exchanger 1-like isoform X1 [Doryrhamphus excisus]XP_057938671.1 ecto-NOX disulfide-thiol exchanger 1-like isoform X1 [Doryrhamphus excisus]